MKSQCLGGTVEAEASTSALALARECAMTGFRRRCAGIVSALIVQAALSAGEPPTITRLTPQGGQRGSSFDVQFSGKAGDGELRLISQGESVSLVLNEQKTGGKVSIVGEARPGVHWLRFSNPFGATELLPFFVGLIPETPETEPNARVTEAQSAALPSVTINGLLEKANDVDTFVVDLAEGQTLVASLTANEILNSPMDAVLQVCTRRGIVVAQNHDDCGLDPRLTFTAPIAGQWYIRAFAFPADPNSTIGFAGGPDYRYRLTLTTAGVVEHTIPVARPRDSGNQPLGVHGWNLAAAEMQPEAGATHLTTSLALPFRIPETRLPVKTEDALPAEALKPPFAVSGEILSDKADLFSLSAVKGQKLRLTVTATSLGSHLDPVLVISDAAGRELKQSDDISRDNRDAELDIVIPADGTYSVSVADRFEKSGTRCFYLLSCEELRPQFTVTLKSTVLTIPADKPLEVPVVIDRKNGFSEPIDFRVAGLPEGVVAELPRSEKDGDTSKSVTLKLSRGTAAPFRGAVRIEGVSVETKVPVDAEFSLSDGTTVAELWLTIPE